LFQIFSASGAKAKDKKKKGKSLKTKNNEEDNSSNNALAIPPSGMVSICQHFPLLNRLLDFAC
jgi:hypothetical protein